MRMDVALCYPDSKQVAGLMRMDVVLCYPDSKLWFTTSFLQTLPKLITPSVSKMSANGQFFVDAQMAVRWSKRSTQLN